MYTYNPFLTTVTLNTATISHYPLTKPFHILDEFRYDISIYYIIEPPYKLYYIHTIIN